MQGLQSAAAAMVSSAAAYMVESRPAVVAGGCVTACGVKTSVEAWHTLKNAETIGQQFKGFGFLVAGAVTTSVGVVMMLTAAGWSPIGNANTEGEPIKLHPNNPLAEVGCAWMDENEGCDNGEIILTCSGSNTQTITNNKFEICDFLQDGMCKDGYLLDCRGAGGGDGGGGALHVYKAQR